MTDISAAWAYERREMTDAEKAEDALRLWARYENAMESLGFGEAVPVIGISHSSDSESLLEPLDQARVLAVESIVWEDLTTIQNISVYNRHFARVWRGRENMEAVYEGARTRVAEELDKKGLLV